MIKGGAESNPILVATDADAQSEANNKPINTFFIKLIILKSIDNFCKVVEVSNLDDLELKYLTLHFTLSPLGKVGMGPYFLNFGSKLYALSKYGFDCASSPLSR